MVMMTMTRMIQSSKAHTASPSHHDGPIRIGRNSGCRRDHDPSHFKLLARTRTIGMPVSPD
eukprot:2489926-Rhodomonas_salina.2